MAATPTIRLDTFDLVIVDEAGQIADTVGELGSGGTYVEPKPGGGALSMPAPFLGRSEVAVTKDGYLILDSDRGVLSKYSPRGELRWIAADFGVPREPLTPAMIEASRARLKSATPSPIDVVGAFDRAPKPDSLPLFGWSGGHRIRGLIAAEDGSAWLLRYSGITDQRMTWIVVGADGEVMGLAHADVETEILAIQDSLFLTRRWDADGAERIEILKANVDRPGRGR